MGVERIPQHKHSGDSNGTLQVKVRPLFHSPHPEEQMVTNTAKIKTGGKNLNIQKRGGMLYFPRFPRRMRANG